MSSNENDGTLIMEIRAINAKLDSMKSDLKADIAELNAKMDCNTLNMNQRFAEVDERFAKAETAMETTSQRINLVEKSVNDTLTSTVDDVSADIKTQIGEARSEFQDVITATNDRVFTERIDEAHTSMKNAFAETFREIELEVERYLIKRRNRRLQLEEANRKVNRIDLLLEDNDMKSYSGTQTKDYTNTEIVTVDISELSTIDEQSELEIVNDIEVDWDEDFVFDHSGIESKLIVTEQQPMEVESLFFHSKCYVTSVTQQEVPPLQVALSIFIKLQISFYS